MCKLPSNHQQHQRRTKQTQHKGLKKKGKAKQEFHVHKRRVDKDKIQLRINSSLLNNMTIVHLRMRYAKLCFLVKRHRICKHLSGVIKLASCVKTEVPLLQSPLHPASPLKTPSSSHQQGGWHAPKTYPSTRKSPKTRKQLRKQKENTPKKIDYTLEKGQPPSQAPRKKKKTPARKPLYTPKHLRLSRSTPPVIQPPPADLLEKKSSIRCRGIAWEARRERQKSFLFTLGP